MKYPINRSVLTMYAYIVLPSSLAQAIHPSRFASRYLFMIPAINLLTTALLLLYDVTNKVSFDNIRAWLVEIREYAQEDVVIILLGELGGGPPLMLMKQLFGINV